MRMTLQQLHAELKKITYNGKPIPLAYFEFGRNEEVTFPNIVYYQDDTSNFSADNQVYLRVRNITIDINSDVRLLDLEQQLEDILTSNKIYFDTTYLNNQAEQLHLARYEISII